MADRQDLADRNLLIGTLALQMGFVSAEQLIAVVGAWALDRRRPLDQLLTERGLLSDRNRKSLELLVDVHFALADESSDPTSLEGSPRLGHPSNADASDRPTDVDGADATIDRPDPTVSLSRIGAAPTGRFQTLRPLGRGNLGVVSVALDVELNREVALKEIRADRADLPDSRVRFLLEAELTGRLEHPGIVPVYGLGRTVGDRPFYAMRLVRGESLKEAVDRVHRDHLERGRGPIWRSLPLIQLLRRFLQVCEAVAYAHSRGVIHRDLKPANIMLGPFGEALVVDWGLAKVVGHPTPANLAPREETLRPASASGSSETVAGTVVGTPAFMSPEQAAGRHDRVGPASDIYSLGATLHVVLTAQSPVEAGQAGSVLLRVTRGDVLSPRRLAPDLPRELDAICRKAMALRPEDRYATAAQLAADLEHWLADEPVSAFPEGLVQRLGRWSRRHRAWVRAGAAASLVLALVASASALVVYRAWTDTDHARLLERQAKSQALRSAHSERGQRQLAQANLEKADALSARLLLDKAIHLCQLGDVNTGLLWLAEALEAAEKAEPSLGPVIRGNLAAWSRDSSRLQHAVAHPGPVACVAIRPDSRLVATASGNTIHLWDPITGTPKRKPLDSNQNPITGLQFLPDGRTLLACSWDFSIVRWDLDLGLPIGEPLREVGPVNAIALSPNAQTLAAAGHFADGGPMIHLWDLDTGQAIGPPLRHGGGVTVLDLAFHPDGRSLAAAGEDGVVRFWDVATATPTGVQLKHPRPVQSIAFHHGGRTLLTGCLDGVIRSWNLDDGSFAAPLEVVHQEAVSDVNVSPDGRLLLTASWDATARLWDATAREPVGPPLQHLHAIGATAFAPDGSFFVTVANDGVARLWHPPDGPPGSVLARSDDPMRLVAFHPNGQSFLASEGDGTIRLRHADTGEPAGLVVHDDGVVDRIAYSPDGRRFLTAREAEVRLWDAATGLLVGQPLLHEGRLRDLRFSPDSRRLLTGTRSGILRAWDTESARPIGAPMPHSAGVAHIEFEPNNGRALASYDDGLLRAWNLETGLGDDDPYQHTDTIRTFAFSPDGRAIALGMFNGTARLLDPPSDSLQSHIGPQRGPVMDLVFTTRGDLIVTSGGGDLHRFRAATGEPLAPVLPNQGPVLEWAVDPEKLIALAGRVDGTVQAWDLATAYALGPPLRFGQPVTDLAPHPSGRRLLACAGTNVIRMWSRPESWQGTPREVRTHVQLLTGMTLRDGAALTLDARSWNAIKQPTDAASQARSLERSPINSE